MSNTIPAIDLTQRPPRSLRVRLGGYVILPRMLDKGRAELIGKSGDFHYACPMDQRWIQFTEVDPVALKAELATGKGDGEILDWIQANAKHQREPWEIQQWSEFQERRGPDSDEESFAFFSKYVNELSKTRKDLKTWADVLDLDDFVSYGGKA